jgi:anti-sigma-K factor RskA
MNRYQFEDLISEYIENELSLSKRKEFETYLEENPDARELVESIRTNMAQMKTIPKVIVSPDFNDRLLARIQSDHTRLDIPITSRWSNFEPSIENYVVFDNE